jgi:hypothetical protein
VIFMARVRPDCGVALVDRADRTVADAPDIALATSHKEAAVSIRQ